MVHEHNYLDGRKLCRAIWVAGTVAHISPFHSPQYIFFRAYPPMYYLKCDSAFSVNFCYCLICVLFAMDSAIVKDGPIDLAAKNGGGSTAVHPVMKYIRKSRFFIYTSARAGAYRAVACGATPSAVVAGPPSCRAADLIINDLSMLDPRYRFEASAASVTRLFWRFTPTADLDAILMEFREYQSLPDPQLPACKFR